MKLSSLIGMEVVGASGKHRGHLIDLRSAGEAELGETHRARVITEVVVGRFSWLERMGLRSVREEIIPWAEVEKIGTKRITLKNE